MDIANVVAACRTENRIGCKMQQNEWRAVEKEWKEYRKG